MRLKLVSTLMIAAVAAGGLMVSGCTKKPSQEEMTRLEDARSAAESAERKLDELRQERQTLEQQLTAKEGDLKGHEAERDSLKKDMGK